MDPIWLDAHWIEGHAVIPEWPSRGGSQRVVSADQAEAALRLMASSRNFGRDDLMAVCAVRYCLGRATYIVDDCCQWLRAVWPEIDPKTRQVIARDIEREITKDDESRARGDAYHPLGMDMDRESWLSIRDLWESAT